MESKKIEHVFESVRPANNGDEGGDSRERFDDRLQRILAAATLVIARDGYQRASMRAIAREADMSLAGLYHYVDGKEKLLYLIQFRAFSTLLMEVQTRLYGVVEPIDQLRVMVRTHVQYAADNMAALRVCSHELDSLSGDGYDQVHRVRREYYELARGIIGRVIEDHAPDSGLDPRIATMSLFGSLNWLYRWYDPAGERSAASLANQIFAQVTRGLCGAAEIGKLPLRCSADTERC
jgi:TetR/AcrR family transcriptional regulator, cholesterol catabolism regulator